MKAIVIREPGGPEVLELRDLPSPPLVAGHVRVAVCAAGCNRADLLQRAGFYPAPPGVLAQVPGLEYAGDVVELGDGVRNLALGDRVHGLVAGGAYASELVVHERETVKIPEGVTHAQAAAVPEAFVTAYDALLVRAGAKPGDRVLVHAAGSGVGTAAIQLARAMGCVTIGTSRTEAKLARCKELGLDHAIVSTTAGGFAPAVQAVTDGQGADVVIDLVGGAFFAETLRACAPRARVVCIGLTAGTRAEVELGLVLGKRLTIVGTTLRSRPLEEKIEAAHLLARPIAAWVAKGVVRAVVDRVLPLADAPEAHRLLASDATFGKVILRVA